MLDNHSFPASKFIIHVYAQKLDTFSQCFVPIAMFIFLSFPLLLSLSSLSLSHHLSLSLSLPLSVSLTQKHTHTHTHTHTHLHTRTHTISLSFLFDFSHWNITQENNRVCYCFYSFNPKIKRVCLATAHCTKSFQKFTSDCGKKIGKNLIPFCLNISVSKVCNIIIRLIRGP